MKFALTVLLCFFTLPFEQLSAQRIEADETLRVIEATKSVDREGETWWRKRHQAKLKLKEEMDQVDVVFIGDSITHSWESIGKETWEKHYGSRYPLNLGFSGDKTENVIWRIRHGQVDYIEPKLAIIMIGTNNTGHRQDKPEDTAAGIKQILTDLQAKLPETRILLLGIFPRGVKATDKLREINDQVNALISQYADNETVWYMDIGSAFLEEDGTLPAEIMPDRLHPNARGYEIWAEAMEAMVKQLMDEE